MPGRRAFAVYRGRFAPSPSGPLHEGSLVAALASYLDARAHRGQWLLRIEDIDTPRVVAGAEAFIMQQLHALGMRWDEEPVRQSDRHAIYQAAFRQLLERGLIYGCACTRRMLSGGPYPGTCRNGLPPGKTGRAIRVRVDDAVIRFVDRLQGEVVQELARSVGDFVVRRADGVYAYQLAVVVDDAWQGVTDVVRGADLLDSTPRQIHLQRLLDLPTPRYLHVPVATNARGEKLSKQTLAAPVDAKRPGCGLTAALDFLGHPVPDALRGAPPADILDWAVAHWNPAALPRARHLPISEAA